MRGFGSITPVQVEAASAELEALSRTLSAQHEIIRRARQEGFDQHLVGQAEAEYARLVGRLQAMSEQVSDIPVEAFDEWRLRLQSFGTEVDLFSRQTRESFAHGSKQRTSRIVWSTLGALAVAGLIGGIIWYASPSE